MQENIFDKINKVVSWKSVLIINFLVIALAVTGFTVYNVSQPYKENRSFAGEIISTATPYSTPNYPADPPVIARVPSFFGKPGDAIVVLGNNFGDSQWGSRAYISGVEVSGDHITQWSNTRLDLIIPANVQTGKVSVNINGKEAVWNGNLIVSDPSTAIEVGLSSVSATNAQLFISKAYGATHGKITLSIYTEPVTFTPGPGILVTTQTLGSDALGKTLEINLNMTAPPSGERISLGNIDYPTEGGVGIIEAEIYNGQNQILPIFTNPLNLQSTPQ